MPIGADDLARETIREFLIDLEAALVDRRPQRRANVAGLGAYTAHREGALPRNSCKDAAPSGMDRADDPLARIEHQNRHTIGARNREDYAGRCRHHPIAGRHIRGVVARDDVNLFAVNLTSARDESFLADSLAQSPPVLVDIGAVVAHPIREVQARIWARADSADTAQKAVTNFRALPRREDRNR
jgi:hypothetical protein